ncbi:hypothetical protein [Phenylobacterium sp.]|uniref:hypothetical protein n=1 Tax=Phenylobacterium sp. TaxID=1871053 RepID=UPI0027369856|nr:hypothetical protein [Phenylobacterium sp.]MDP3660973.1 hypothetical protein [Phenylobacterium sp.]
MSQEQSDTIELRRSAMERYLPVAGGLIMLVPTAFLLIVAIGVVRESPAVGLFILVIAVLMVLLTLVVAIEARDRWRTRIRIVGGEVTLSLPRYLERPPLERAVPLADLAAVDWREEVFRSIGLSAMHQAYALALNDGTRLVMGGDKQMAGSFYAEAARTIAERAGVPIRQLGMFDGHGGVMQVTGMRAPDWASQPLDAASAAKRRRAVDMTYRAMWAVIVLAIVLRLLVEFI